MPEEPMSSETAEIRQQLEAAAADNEVQLRQEMQKIESKDAGRSPRPNKISLDELVQKLRDELDRDTPSRRRLEAEIERIERTERLTAEDYNIRINVRP